MVMGVIMDNKLLYNKAKKAAKASYSPYSLFRVGAALVCESGEVYLGCNIENASFSATICAERAALSSAVAAGERGFTAIAVAGGKVSAESGLPEWGDCMPCGVCLQALSEFCGGEFKIVTQNHEYLLSELLPVAFKLN